MNLAYKWSPAKVCPKRAEVVQAEESDAEETLPRV